MKRFTLANYPNVLRASNLASKILEVTTDIGTNAISYCVIFPIWVTWQTWSHGFDFTHNLLTSMKNQFVTKIQVTSKSIMLTLQTMKVQILVKLRFRTNSVPRSTVGRLYDSASRTTERVVDIISKLKPEPSADSLEELPKILAVPFQMVDKSFDVATDVAAGTIKYLVISPLKMTRNIGPLHSYQKCS